MTKLLNITVFILLGLMASCSSGERGNVLHSYSTFRKHLIAKEYSKAYDLTNLKYKKDFKEKGLKLHFINPDTVDLTQKHNKYKQGDIIEIKGKSARLYLSLKNGFGNVVMFTQAEDGKWLVEKDVGSWSE